MKSLFNHRDSVRGLRNQRSQYASPSEPGQVTPAKRGRGGQRATREDSQELTSAERRGSMSWAHSDGADPHPSGCENG
jgi:hypothetical protein